MKFGLTADSSSCSASKFVFHRIQVFPSLKAAAPSFESLNCRRPLFLPLSPSPVSSAPIKTRMESIRWLAPIIVLLPKGGASAAVAPPEIWLSGPPPLPYFALGPHPSPGAAATGGWRQGMGLPDVPCRNLQHHVGRRPSSSASWESATLPHPVKQGKGKDGLGS